MVATFYLASAASLFVVVGTILFGARKTSYSHINDTISELGETGAKDEKIVNLGLFLPVGLLLLATSLFSTDSTTAGLALVLSIGYLVAAFFPCDEGSPLISGSWRQQIHNLGGTVQYLGGIFFISQSDVSLFGTPHGTLVILLFVGLLLISIPSFPLRGLAQRITEVILFGSLIQLSYI